MKSLKRIRLAQATLRRSNGTWSEPDVASGGLLSRRALLRGVGGSAVALGLGGAWPVIGQAKLDRDARVVIVGAGIAGLGCAHRLWHTYGTRAEVYEWSGRTGGRIRTLRSYFDDDQLVEEHAEFINPEHTATLALARELRLTLDNTFLYPRRVNPDQESFWFDGRSWSQESVNTLFGKATLKLPAATQSATTFRLRGKGMPHLRGSGQGDQLVRVQVEVPASLTGEQRRVLEEFARVCGDADNPTGKSWFEKARKFF